VGTTDLWRLDGGVDAVVVPFVVESGRGSSHAGHLDLATSLLSMHTPHVQDPAATAGRFIPAALQSKPTEAGFAPKENANVGREDGFAAKAALRSLAWLKGD
jgi:hypothetical protein